jgi:PelA/Pel-15E family pectate lyase
MKGVEMRTRFAFVGVFVVVACSSAPTPGDFSASGSGGAMAGAGGSAAGTGGSGSTGATGGSAGGAAPAVDCNPAPVPITAVWDRINAMPAAFYSTAEAVTLAKNVLYYQNPDGGWPKNVEMTSTTAMRARSTIDNEGTTLQIEYLSKVFGATGCAEFGDAAIAGVEYLLNGQYENGGWPQEFPNSDDYHTHITFNDNAMVRVMELLRRIAQHAAPYTFFDDAFAMRADDAVQRGIDCMLACQIEADGERTGWCAQHDEVTLEPAQARTYELPSLSGSEAVGIVRFLMSIPTPSADVREAIEGAVAWFEAVKITGIRIEATVDASQPTGEDRVVVEDPSAPPIWARFYELRTNRPMFSSRCEVPECDDDPYFMVRYSLAEIDNERRVGYAWYGTWPATLLSADYPAWRQRVGPQ